jgi:drug/metabolite transporter (DMT)-like permease
VAVWRITRADLARHPEAFAIALVFSTIAIWGSTAQVTDVGSAYAHPLTLTALRAVPTPFALLLALPLLRFRLPSDRQAWLYTAISGLLMVGVFLGGFTEAIIRAGPANAIVLSSTSPFWVALLSRLVYRERISLTRASGLVCGFGGVLLVFSSQLGSHAGAGRTVSGLLFALAAAFGWAIGTLIVKELMTRRPDCDLMGIVAGQYLIGGAALIVLALGVEGTGGAQWSAPNLWLAVAYISVVSSAIATVLYFGALKRLSPTRVTAWSFLTPVVAILIGIGLGDTPSATTLIGMVVTIAGVGIANLPRDAAPVAVVAAPQPDAVSP